MSVNLNMLQTGCSALGVSVDSFQQEKMMQHLDLLMKWSKAINLTAIKTYEGAVGMHVLDSLSLVPFVRGNSLFDVGSGAGFPGIPVAIMFPESEVVLIESRGKRAVFLRMVARELGLANVSVEKKRAEEMSLTVEGGCFMTRGFAPLKRTHEALDGLLFAGSRLLCLKSKEANSELEQVSRDSYKSAKIISAQVPFVSGVRNIVVIDY